MFEGNLIHVSRVPSKWPVSILSPSFVLYVRFGCCRSGAKSCPALCDPRDCSMPGSSGLHYLLEFPQVHIRCRWCHPTISSSVVPFSFCLTSFPASGSFSMCRLFPSGDLSVAASASASVLPMNSRGWFPLGLTGWISLLSKGLLRVFSSTTVQNISSLLLSFLYGLELLAKCKS